MSPNLAMISDSKKFMWDGELYDTKEEASRVAQSYHDEDFEIQVLEHSGKFLVYTRKTPQEVAVTAR